MLVPPPQPGAGNWFANAAPVTPGVCRSASINRACSERRASRVRLGIATSNATRYKEKGRVSLSATRP